MKLGKRKETPAGYYLSRARIPETPELGTWFNLATADHLCQSFRISQGQLSKYLCSELNVPQFLHLLINDACVTSSILGSGLSPVEDLQNMGESGVNKRNSDEKLLSASFKAS